MSNVNYTTSELFSLMNKLKKMHGISQKEAYQMAKQQLEGKQVASVADELIQAMKSGNVRFTFRNRGKEITTTGHMRFDKVSNTRSIQGKKEARSANHVVFYDVRHGVYRQFEKSEVVSFIALSTKVK